VAHEVVFEPADAVTTGRDTRLACRAFEEAGAQAVLFVGGDGTARDVLAALGTRLPVLGVPSGVKMHSGAFAVSPSAAARILRAYSEGGATVAEGDVLDEDEQDLREGRIRVRLAGHLRCLSAGSLLQASKQEYGGEVEEASKQGIADALLERMDDATLYLFGPGSTPGAVMEAMGLKHTLLGVDLVRAGALVRADATAAQVAEAIEAHGGPVELVVTVVGRQGFVFGRGNLQLTPAVLRAIGKDRITIVAAEEKAAALTHLLAETGDPALDAELAGHWRVLCGYRFHVLLPLAPASAPE
jgi:predicted polyphosphate/ATP-dependent NAD kinase